jgi:tetratricopeptide (TPR) repeat protein
MRNGLDWLLSSSDTPNRVTDEQTETPTVTRYTRQDVLRILHLRTRQLVAWEREGLIPTVGDGEQYSFEHLARLRALREMRSKRMTARSIRAQVDAMQKVAGMRNALVETSAVRRGTRLAFRYGGALVDAITQQLTFDFATNRTANRGGQLQVVGQGFSKAIPPVGGALETAQVQQMFVRAVQLEENPATLDEAMLTYEAILTIRQDHAPACINLGTIFYNRRDFVRAEDMYRRATDADPEYALAFFDLGNVLDEMQRLNDAIEAYTRAIAIVPTYADAHYNLALAFERKGERRRALRHWMAYVRLDPVGPWAAHAKAQARKILALEKLRIVSRSGRKVAS